MVKHIFMLCDNFDGTREYLHVSNDLQEIDDDIVVNETLIRYGHNKKGESNLVDSKSIREYIPYMEGI